MTVEHSVCFDGIRFDGAGRLAPSEQANVFVLCSGFLRAGSRRMFKEKNCWRNGNFGCAELPLSNGLRCLCLAAPQCIVAVTNYYLVLLPPLDEPMRSCFGPVGRTLPTTGSGLTLLLRARAALARRPANR